ncbi:DNA-directed RNA polymerase subunit A' [Thermoproteus sp. CP80]|uniref:DNA-directed RNA polymerase subunit A' n=1 Tax=Thermoproteus sp. CP80 TaxID=1650659 RepID=UPI0009BFC85D|nr:DNA-directed RNA polymerase subunit A' [Thermoproteus sp. CP80]PLC67133.1 DNA-directed RNA polymerase subunit A' [Thermoproteus sp. CP80]
MAVQQQDYIPTKTIRDVKFGILSSDLIRRYSVLEITTSEIYDEGGLPIRGGLMDRRLGVAEPGARCETCGQPYDVCPGHFGHIELVKPVIHVEFARFIYDVLRATCPNCGRIMLKDEEIRRYSERLQRLRGRWKLLATNLHEKILRKAAERTTCPHCGYRRNKVRFERPYNFYEETEAGALVKLDPETILERLVKVPNGDLELLGVDPTVARPEWAILRTLPVPPPHVRPSIQLETGIRSEDDLTHKLVDIMRMNEKLKIALETGAPTNVIDNLWDLLQYHTATYFDNELPGIPLAKHRGGRPLKGIAQRLKGKEGRFRGSLSGKRVNFSARTAISPDPNLSINEVGVPVDIAKVLTVPERVTEWNLDYLRQAVMRGPETWPGANYVITPEGRRVDLRYVKDRKQLAEKLAPGWMVERHIRDGDIALFNRQPSLHRVSMMGHIVRVLPGRTFRIHLAVCPPYNADFDGDEMNLHIPQTEEARAEARTLMLVQEHIVTPRYGGAIIGARQDYIIGAYLLSRKTTLLTKKEAAYLAGAMKLEGDLPEPAIMHPVELWTGKQIISMALPKDLNWVQPTAFKSTCKEPYGCETDEWIIIINGNMVTGTLDKKSIGAEQVDSLWHRIARDYPADIARRWLDSSLRAFLRYLDLKGFSIGLDSLHIPDEAMAEVDKIIRSGIDKAMELIELYREGKLEAMPGYTVQETLENRLAEILSKVRSDAEGVVDRYINRSSEAYLMAKTGARGSLTNIVQMVATLGQQTIRGERIKRGYRTRTLPHFPVGDIGPFSGGFVSSSFIKGLTPVEYFFHAAGGRDGLIDTAVRTAQSGYMQRRIINALQDAYVAYDGTVRYGSGLLLQPLYGDDGTDVSKSDHGKSANVNIMRLYIR